MRWYLGILGLIIFGAGSFMSWGHTATFFADNGFGKGYDPISGVFVVECLFLMGAGAEIYMRKTGKKSTLSIKSALIVGALTVFWANFRYGLEYGWEGMAAGTIIIVAIVIAENVLADIVLAIQKERAASDQESGTPVPVEPDGVPFEPAGGRENGTPVPDDPGGVPDTPAAQLYMYHREKGKLPGRVRVSRICGMEERHARRALARVNDAAREEDDREEVA